MQYPVVLFDEGGDPRYGVVVPDLPGCVSAGASVEEALQNVRQAIRGHLEVMADDNDPIPEPTEIQAHINQDPDYFDGGIWAVVEVSTPMLQAA